MKKLLSSLFVIFFLSLSGQETQSNEIENIDILNSNNLKKGLYYSFNQFQNNFPSDTNYVVRFDKEFSWDQNYGENKARKVYIYDENGNKIKIEKPLWGFCDGEDIYIFYKQHYCIVHTIGRFCIISMEIAKRNQYIRTKYLNKDYLLDIFTGEVFKLNSENLKEIVLKNDPVLLVKFQNERKVESMFYWYVNEVNSKYK